MPEYRPDGLVTVVRLVGFAVGARAGLTPRETEVLAGLSQGWTHTAISRAFAMQEPNVHKFLERAKEKLLLHKVVSPAGMESDGFLGAIVRGKIEAIDGQRSWLETLDALESLADEASGMDYLRWGLSKNEARLILRTRSERQEGHTAGKKLLSGLSHKRREMLIRRFLAGELSRIDPVLEKEALRRLQEPAETLFQEWFLQNARGHNRILGFFSRFIQGKTDLFALVNFSVFKNERQLVHFFEFIAAKMAPTARPNSPAVVPASEKSRRSVGVSVAGGTILGAIPAFFLHWISLDSASPGWWIGRDLLVLLMCGMIVWQLRDLLHMWSLGIQVSGRSQKGEWHIDEKLLALANGKKSPMARKMVRRAARHEWRVHEASRRAYRRLKTWPDFAIYVEYLIGKFENFAIAPWADPLLTLFRISPPKVMYLNALRGLSVSA